MMLVAGLLYRGIRQGIEYWTKMMTSGLFVIFIALVAYNVTLDGFGEAVRFAFTPNTSVFKASGLLEAVGLAFFNLSVGQGILITYGSYMKPVDDLPKTAAIVTAMVLVISALRSLYSLRYLLLVMSPQEALALSSRCSLYCLPSCLVRWSWRRHSLSSSPLLP